MSIVSAIETLLEADATLVAILTGGIHDTGEITRQLAPAAFNANNEIKPCALLKSSNELAMQNKIQAVQTPLVIYLYQRSGYTAIDAALARIHTLLEQLHIGTSSVWEVQFNSEIARTVDEGLKCPMAVQRWNLIRKRA
jgi:hypothetical protein